jgi:anti-sigma B factor antagonist
MSFFTDLDIKHDIVDTDVVVWVRGELDVASAPRLREAMLDALAGRDDAFVITLDMSGIEFLDSTGLGVLVAVLKRMRFVGGDLVIRAPSRSVRKLFGLTGLDKVFTVEADEMDQVPEVGGGLGPAPLLDPA